MGAWIGDSEWKKLHGDDNKIMRGHELSRRRVGADVQQCDLHAGSIRLTRAHFLPWQSVWIRRCDPSIN
jgi:hypothetical protein